MMGSFTRSDVGITRVLFFGCLSFLVPFDQLVEAASVPDWQQCTYLDMFWPSPDLNVDSALTLEFLLRLSLFTAAAGLFTTISYWTAFVSLSVLMLNWLPFCFSTHEMAPVPFAILLWALLDRNSSYRVEDRWFTKRPHDQETSPLTALLIPAQQLHFVLIFISTGISKLMNGGLEWMMDPTLQDIIIFQNFFFEGAWPSRLFPVLNQWLTGWPIACVVLSIIVVVIETFAPLAILSRRAAMLIIPSLIMMQISICIFLYIAFFGWIALYMFWIPVRVFKFVERQVSEHR